MYEKILIPTDGSDTALLAAKYARALAEKFDSEVAIVHVIQNYYTLPAFSMPDTVTIPASVMQDLESNGQLILEKTKEIFSGLAGKVSARLEYGPPGKAVIDIVEEEKFSLIVMGHRGLSGVSEMLLGSVSRHVLHYASCPILIIKGDGTM